MEITPKNQLLTITVSCALLLLSSFIFVGGIADQLRFGPDSKCLLYINNYHKENNTWVFAAQSAACGWALAFGSLDIIFAVALIALHFLYFKKGDSIPRQTLKILLWALAVWAILSMCIAAVVSGGLGIINLTISCNVL